MATFGGLFLSLADHPGDHAIITTVGLVALPLLVGSIAGFALGSGMIDP